MKTIEKINRDLVIYLNSLTDKKQVLEEIASLVTETGNAGNATEEQIRRALLEREELGSTGFGHGVAIPHCRIPSINGFAIGLLVSGKGIDFDSIDGEDVRIIPFVVGPEENPKEYLKLLSAISQMLRTKDFRKQLLQCGDTEQLQDLIMSQSYVEDETPPRRPGMKMMHVFVQNEDIFDDLLQVFASSESISALVVETHESTDFLMKSPLFAGFWNTDIRRFNRLIVAVVRDELVNATVRNIEYICGKLSERDDILLTVTDLHYVLGSLGG